MPLSPQDRRFVEVVGRLKLYVLLMALAVFCYLVLRPASEIQMATTVLGVALCGVFWITQRLLSFIMMLDFELSRMLNVLKRSLTPEQQKELFR